jgi:DNA-binding transcriptional MerR regulator/methylmalonyl-CoA mutase cobalamin-binding subunit
MHANSQEDVQTEGRHSIAVVSRRTGITQLLLRAWERRYQAVVPSRTPTGRRLYSDRDLEKLSLLQMLTNNGHRISDVANLPLEELSQLAEEIAASQPPAAPVASGAPVSTGSLLEGAITAVSNLDARGLEKTLDKALVHLSKPALRRDLLVPLLVEIGNRWQDGDLRVSHEHMATSIVSAFLTAMNSRYRVSAGAPLLAVATPAGQIHELGALMAASHAFESGWDVLYLGANIPAEEIAAAMEIRGARAVMLSLVFPGADPGTTAELRELRRLMGPAMPIIVGGQASPSYQAILAEIGAMLAADPEQLGGILGAI